MGADNKELQGYVPPPKEVCGKCAFLAVKRRDRYWQPGVFVEQLRCTLGDFEVKSGGTCRRFRSKDV